MNRMSWIERSFNYFVLTALGLLLAAPFVYMISMALSIDATSTRLTFTFIPKIFHF